MLLGVAKQGAWCSQKFVPSRIRQHGPRANSPLSAKVVTLGAAPDPSFERPVSLNENSSMLNWAKSFFVGQCIWGMYLSTLSFSSLLTSSSSENHIPILKSARYQADLADLTLPHLEASTSVTMVSNKFIALLSVALLASHVAAAPVDNVERSTSSNFAAALKATTKNLGTTFPGSGSRNFKNNKREVEEEGELVERSTSSSFAAALKATTKNLGTTFPGSGSRNFKNNKREVEEEGELVERSTSSSFAAALKATTKNLGTTFPGSGSRNFKNNKRGVDEKNLVERSPLSMNEISKIGLPRILDPPPKLPKLPKEKRSDESTGWSSRKERRAVVAEEQ
ncbi:hypothetical protein T439DRAFT_366399 [Meredithblackwellia eburnea MCA 4105]